MHVSQRLVPRALFGRAHADAERALQAIQKDPIDIAGFNVSAESGLVVLVDDHGEW
jgi:hypothetical protein